MTLQIKIENPAGEMYEARVRALDVSPNGERHPSGEVVTLKPGESHELCVYNGRMVEVTEGDNVPVEEKGEG